MTATDTTPKLRDIMAAIGLLSRLPVRVDADLASRRGAKAAWAYPIAGIIIAVIALTVGHLAVSIGLPSGAVAGLTLATLVITTGALHEDGLADSADGLWGGWTPARRLEIMKDSHIGAYGVIALILSLGLRWLALDVLINAGMLAPALIAAAALSRAAMVPLMARVPNARETGLSHLVGRAPDITALMAVGLACLTAVLCLGVGGGILVIAVTAGMTLICAEIARAKINGQTGDILGATQQLTEISALLVLCALAV